MRVKHVCMGLGLGVVVAGAARAEEPVMVAPPTVTEGATMVTETDTTPMPVVVEEGWRLRLGADLAGGVLVPGPAVSGGLALRAGARHKHVSWLVEVGGYGGLGAMSFVDNDVLGASSAALALVSVTPGVQFDVVDNEVGSGFVGVGVILGAGAWTQSEDRVDGDTSRDVTMRVSESSSFIPGVDAKVGWRFGREHNLTVSAGVKVLATAVTTETVDTAGPTSTVTTGPGAVVLPMLTLGYDFR